jgi:hypothetical protein
MVQCLSAFRKDPVQVKNGYTEEVLHVGATGNKLDELKKLLLSKIDPAPKFQSTTFGKYNENIEYMLKGTRNGVEYEIFLEYIGCPVPYSMAEIHHASVRLSDNKMDELSPLIEEEFKKYESELDARIELAYKNSKFY